MSEAEEQDEIRQFAARLSGGALQECLHELASWRSDEADYEVLISGSTLVFDALRSAGRGAELGRAALNVIGGDGPPAAVDVWMEARVPEQVSELIQKVDWRNGSKALKISFAGALGEGGPHAVPVLQQMRSEIRDRDVRKEIDIALHNIGGNAPNV